MTDHTAVDLAARPTPGAHRRVETPVRPLTGGGAGLVVAADVVTAPARRARLPRLTGRPAVYLLASLIVSLLASSASPTPLYAVYATDWHFTPITTTLVFAVYALAVLVALLTLGKLSDHLGRRPVLLAAIVVQLVSLVVFASAGGVPGLILARVVQGVSTGAALGAIGAGMLDIDRERGTFANAVSPFLGTGSGALISAVVVRYLPAPTHTIYLIMLGVLALQGVGVLLMRETVTRKPGALASLVPEIKLPRAVRAHVVAAVPALFAVWSLAGLYGALGPALVHSLTGSSEVVLGALSLSVLTATGIAAVVVLRAASAHTVMLTGLFTLIAGMALTLVSVDLHSAALFFVATAVSGVAFGGGFQGGIRTVVPRVAAHQRSGILSLLYTVSYLGFGLPTVVAGYLVVHGGGLISTAREYSVAVIVLAVLALGATLRTRRNA
jgi:MFS family permease